MFSILNYDVYLTQDEIFDPLAKYQMILPWTVMHIWNYWKECDVLEI